MVIMPLILHWPTGGKVTLIGLGDDALEQEGQTDKVSWRMGDFDALWVWCEHCPPMAPYDALVDTMAVAPGDLLAIGQFTGNHWRKIFNVYAKCVFAAGQDRAQSWQDYRDNELLQPSSGTRLIWQAQQWTGGQPRVLHWIMGKTYAAKLGLEPKAGAVRMNTDFAVNHELNYVITPYFDYRQLSNLKIEQLIKLIRDEWPCG